MHTAQVADNVAQPFQLQEGKLKDQQLVTATDKFLRHKKFAGPLGKESNRH